MVRLRSGAHRKLRLKLPNFIKDQGQIGSGTFGSVHRITDLRRGGGNQVYAMKVLKWDRTWVGDDPSVQQLEGYTAWESRVGGLWEDLEDEGKVLAKLQHKNIVEFKGWLDGEHIRNRLGHPRPFPSLLTGICDGTLYDLYCRDLGPTDKPYVWKMFTQMIDALVYLHDANLIHQDIKPKNILFCCSNELARRRWQRSRRPCNARLLNFKLGDFGMCRGIEDAQGHNPGTRTYMAPEHHNKKPKPQSDIYSLYVTILVSMNIDNLAMRLSDQKYDELQQMIDAAMITARSTKLSHWEYMGSAKYMDRGTAREIREDVRKHSDFNMMEIS